MPAQTGASSLPLWSASRLERIPRHALWEAQDGDETIRPEWGI
jgi:hypothetical protein